MWSRELFCQCLFHSKWSRTFVLVMFGSNKMVDSLSQSFNEDISWQILLPPKTFYWSTSQVYWARLWVGIHKVVGSSLCQYPQTSAWANQSSKAHASAEQCPSCCNSSIATSSSEDTVRLNHQFDSKLGEVTTVNPQLLILQHHAPMMCEINSVQNNEGRNRCTSLIPGYNSIAVLIQPIRFQAKRGSNSQCPVARTATHAPMMCEIDNVQNNKGGNRCTSQFDSKLQFNCSSLQN